MTAHRLPLALFLLTGCNDTPDAKGKVESQQPPPVPVPAPSQKPVERADEDPDFTHVDRDQLAALCLATKLPPVSGVSDYGALALADGSRVPWLTVWVDEAEATAVGEPWVSAKVRTSQASTDVKWQMSLIGPSPTPPTRTGHSWLNHPCDGSEAFWVVVTGVFFQKDGFHAVAMRGREAPRRTATFHDSTGGSIPKSV